VLGLWWGDVQPGVTRSAGLLGSPPIATGCRVLLKSGAPDARLAVDYFVYRAAREIGALAAVLRGIDGLVFTAGIGEHSAEIRARICDASSWPGLELDRHPNTQSRSRISTNRSRVSAWVIPTNEELMIARHTGSLLGLAHAADGAPGAQSTDADEMTLSLHRQRRSIGRPRASMDQD